MRIAEAKAKNAVFLDETVSIEKRILHKQPVMLLTFYDLCLSTLLGLANHSERIPDRGNYP